MRFISSVDPEIVQHRDSYQHEIQQCEAMGISYWIGVDHDCPVGFFVVGKEPIRLIAPIGTTVALLSGLATDTPSATYYDMAARCIELAKANHAQHVFLNLNSIKYKDAIEQFQKAGFSTLVDSCHMQITLDDSHDYAGNLQFERVERAAMERFLSLMKDFMKDASDEMLRIILDNFGKVPEQMLDMLFESDEFYVAYNDKAIVAILDICPGAADNVSNLGVSPEHRGLGYGKQVLHFAMDLLKKRGLDKAQLRVSLANKPAISLYESLGFKETQRDTALIWRT